METDPILSDALRRRDAAQAEMRRWDEFVRTYQELAGNVRRTPSSSAQSTASVAQEASSSGAKGALAETEAAAILAIEDAGHPLHTRELLFALADMGIEVGGKDPASTLSARLSRAERLENIRPHGWRLKGQGAEGGMFANIPSAPESTPDSADEDGREVAHDNMSH